MYNKIFQVPSDRSVVFVVRGGNPRRSNDTVTPVATLDTEEE